MKEEIKEVEVVYLTVGVARYSKKWEIFNYHFNEDYAKMYLDVVPNIYPGYQRYFIVRYVRSGIIAEIE